MSTLRNLFDGLYYYLSDNNLPMTGEQGVYSVCGIEVLVSDDADNGRIVVWSEIPIVSNGDVVAEACVRYSEVSFDERGTSVGLSLDGTGVVVGRSVLLEELTAADLASLIRSIADEVETVRTMLQDRIHTQRSAERAEKDLEMGQSIVVRA